MILIRTVFALRHEFIEFGFVLGLSQLVEKCLKLTLLLFQSLKGLFAIGIKGRVSARRIAMTTAMASA